MNKQTRLFQLLGLMFAAGRLNYFGNAIRQPAKTTPFASSRQIERNRRQGLRMVTANGFQLIHRS